MDQYYRWTQLFQQSQLHPLLCAIPSLNIAQRKIALTYSRICPLQLSSSRFERRYDYELDQEIAIKSNHKDVTAVEYNFQCFTTLSILLSPLEDLDPVERYVVLYLRDHH